MPISLPTVDEDGNMSFMLCDKSQRRCVLSSLSWHIFLTEILFYCNMYLKTGPPPTQNPLKACTISSSQTPILCWSSFQRGIAACLSHMHRQWTPSWLRVTVAGLEERWAAELEPWLPEKVVPWQLVWNSMQRSGVVVYCLVYDPEDFIEAALSFWSQWDFLFRVCGQIEEQWRIMSCNESSMAEANVRIIAAIGVLRTEVWSEEEDFPDRFTCNLQPQNSWW